MDVTHQAERPMGYVVWFLVSFNQSCIPLPLSLPFPPSLLSPSRFFVPVSDKKEDLVIPPVVMPTPGKRGRKKKSMMQRAGANLPPGSDALILAHLAAGGQVIESLK